MKKFLTTLGISIFILFNSFSQVDSTFTKQYVDEPLSDIIVDVENHFNVDVVNSDIPINQLLISTNFEEATFGQVLRYILDGTGYFFMELNNQFFIFESSFYSKEILDLVHANYTNAEFDILGKQSGKFNSVEVGRKEVVISGQVMQSSNDQPIQGVTIKNTSYNEGTLSDVLGNFKIKGFLGENNLVINSYGFASENLSLNLNNDTTLTIDLNSDVITFDEVVVTGNNAQEKVDRPQGGLEKISIRQIKELPTFLGEVDVVKSIISLPGVNTVGEGSSGFNVRGGNVDENLILFDGIPIFNSSHLFGFFSIFNSESIESFDLHKGGFSARYGGRSSSVLDVEGRKGSFTDRSLSGSLGLISTKVSLDGPVIKDKLAARINFRRAYTSLIKTFVNNPEIENKEAGFYDLNVKLDAKFENSSLSFSGLLSGDTYQFLEDTTSRVQNTGASLIYRNYALSNLSFLVKSSYSKYSNGISNPDTRIGFDYESNIEHTDLAAEVIYDISSSSYVEVGIQSILYRLNLGELVPNTEGAFNSSDAGKERALHNSAFIDYGGKLFDKLNYSLGLRYNYFLNIGPTTIYEYQENQLPYKNVSDSTSISGNSVYNTYSGLEPRVSLSYSINKKSSVKFGYNLTNQYINLISNSVAISPVSYWKLSDSYIKPRITNQVSLGYFLNMDIFNFQVEPFYKWQTNLLEYRAGSQVFINESLERDLLLADGYSYGSEFKLEKSGRLNGWLSYTYSRTLRRIISNVNESVAGEIFPANFDSPHNFNAVVNYKVSKRISISSNFQYRSGRPFTIPESIFEYQGTVYANFSKRNDGRIPDYHRLDLSMTLKSNLKKTSKFKGEWNFSLYNVYARRNPFTIFYGTVGDGRLPQAYKLSVLGSMFPSVGYNFTLK
ncbi:collagen-binding protein [Marivirga tractuosa]|uniref:TonB-dependent receptor plug n=1 Tax=Marivirga tractuosa (strain ATCC 23168 / DSM 4126 / NBRC 15989 / NCIMB 1408 / VKM B-1430 / H-43) TaxID=643867 RepID=E4TSE4_MARTH|nr:carboxypeptidase-like regulatory domain-containing protein [Marivirga tractuosa]ADR22861.1 TonB-dependent receptor plug [Marivirga tractuosa DSM 4126]BDD16467.1 collagen-binding protein [Marivirga tractuosa]